MSTAATDSEKRAVVRTTIQATIEERAAVVSWLRRKANAWKCKSDAYEADQMEREAERAKARTLALHEAADDISEGLHLEDEKR